MAPASAARVLQIRKKQARPAGADHPSLPPSLTARLNAITMRIRKASGFLIHPQANRAARKF
jgi:hypothetical protein